jgi:hypothetical protein
MMVDHNQMNFFHEQEIDMLNLFLNHLLFDENFYLINKNVSIQDFYLQYLN